MNAARAGRFGLPSETGRWRWAGLAAAAVCVGASGCALLGIQTASTEKVLAQKMVSDEQEVQLGLQVHEELTQQNVKYLKDPKVTAYVDGLVIKLAQNANADRPGIDWKWFVIDDPETVNAFATPGGRIYVYTGLLLAARNEAEVVGVLGHELGHVVERHSARQLVAAKGFDTVAAMALGQDPNDVAALVAGLAGKGGMLAYGREMETEADRSGVKYAAAVNANPDALATFFELMQSRSDIPGRLVFLSSHPTHAQRVADIRANIAATGARGSELGTERLAAIKPLLKR